MSGSLARSTCHRCCSRYSVEVRTVMTETSLQSPVRRTSRSSLRRTTEHSSLSSVLIIGSPTHSLDDITAPASFYSRDTAQTPPPPYTPVPLRHARHASDPPQRRPKRTHANDSPDMPPSYCHHQRSRHSVPINQWPVAWKYCRGTTPSPFTPGLCSITVHCALKAYAGLKLHSTKANPRSKDPEGQDGSCENNVISTFSSCTMNHV